MEISWYLRFHRSSSITFLVAADAAGQVEHALHIEPQWAAELSPCEGGLRAVCIRNVSKHGKGAHDKASC